MDPEKFTAGSSSSAAGDTVSAEVDDAKRALDMASTGNSSPPKPEKRTTKPALAWKRLRKSPKAPPKTMASTFCSMASTRSCTVCRRLSRLWTPSRRFTPSLQVRSVCEHVLSHWHAWLRWCIRTVAVGAFKVVIELEIKRRDNDKKVNLLFLEMKNMMSILLQYGISYHRLPHNNADVSRRLQGVRANHIARDGKTIGARLADSVKHTANDIKVCANVCDTYSKKRLLVKVLKGPIWDDTLKGFIKLFADRKAEFSFAVSIHTGMAIDSANDKLDALTTT